MECKNCHSKWEMGKSASKTYTECPFCGASLADADKENAGFFDNSKEALAFIMRRHGTDVLLGSMLKNFLLDYAPGIATLRKNVVFSVSSSGAADILKSNLTAGAGEKEIAFRRAVSRVVDTYGTERSLVESVMLEFTEALGWEMPIATGSIYSLPMQNGSAVEKEFEQINSNLFEESNDRIIMLGIGGAGQNTINRFIEEQIKGVEFIAISADKEQLQLCKASKCIQVGELLTKGLGVNAKPELGKRAIEESINEIKKAIKGAAVLFICCGMGGGMGTGGSPVVAHAAKEMGIFTVGFVTKPFRFEAKTRMSSALAGIERLKEYADITVVVSNDVSLEMADKKNTMPEVLALIDKVFWKAIICIKSLVVPSSLKSKNVVELRNIVEGKGVEAHVGFGTAKEGEIISALQMAIDCPWLEVSLRDSEQIILYLSGNITEFEMSYCLQYLYSQNIIGHDTNIVYSLDDEKSNSNEVSVIILAIAAHFIMPGFSSNFAKKGLMQTIASPGRTGVPSEAAPQLQMPPRPRSIPMAPQPAPRPVDLESRARSLPLPPGVPQPAPRPVDLKSNASEKSMKIPEFLQRK